MRETPQSTIERSFALKAVKEGLRIDGRKCDERRKLDIRLGHEAGSCLVALGDTRVLAQVSCSLGEPQPSRPNEGVLRIEVDFHPTSAPRFAAANQQQLQQDVQDEMVEIRRLMERILRESGCVDMESLCVVSEVSVWRIRLDLHVLNHEGNVAEAAGVAGLAALAHFKRPDVTMESGEVKVHPPSERDPIPLAIQHYPVASTYAFFEGDSVAVDPGRREEAVMTGKIVFGVNPYREICTLHLAGQMMVDKSVVLRYAHKASQRAKDVVDLIKARLAEDEETRKNDGDVRGFAVDEAGILSSRMEEMQMEIDKIAGKYAERDEEDDSASTTSSIEVMMEVKSVNPHVVELVDKDNNDDNDGEGSEEDEVVIVK